MRRLFVCLFVVTLSMVLFSQSADGYVVAGESASYTYWPPGIDDYDFLVYKLDLDGKKMWRKNFGGYYYDFGKCVRQTPDGGYVLAGSTENWVHGGSGTTNDFVVFKLDIDGRKQWRRNLGGIGYETAYSIDPGSDGDLFVSGGSDSYCLDLGDILVYRLDSTGSKRWRKNLGGDGEDIGYSCRHTPDGGCVIAGNTKSYTHGSGDWDFIVYKLDAEGAKQWRRNFGGDGDDRARSVDLTADGGYVVAGFSDSYSHGETDFLIYKLDADGRKQWRRHLGGSEWDGAYSVRGTSDGGFIVAGASDTYTHGSYDFLVYKLNPDGEKQWRKHFGGALSDFARAAQPTVDGGYILAGSSASYTHGSYDFLVYKLDSSGRKQWRKNYGGGWDDRTRSVCQSISPEIIAGVD